YDVTASVGGAGSASFTLTNTAASPASIVALSGTPQSATVGTAYATPLRVLVRDAFGNPVAGAAVTFAAPAGGPGGTFAGSAPVRPEAGARARAPASTADPSAGSSPAPAAAAGVPTPVLFSMTNTAGSPANLGVVGGTPQSAMVGFVYGSALQL